MKKSAQSRKLDLGSLEFHPLTASRWADFEALFGKRGACGGCWCMWWRLSRPDFERQKGEENRRAMKHIVESGDVPGILAYLKGEPIAWCSVAPRDSFPRLDRSRTLKPLDEQKVWSVVCFFVARPYRRKGLTVLLLEAAREYVMGRGGSILEGYPVEPQNKEMPEVFAWTGFLSAFERAGFSERLRRSETRPIVRCEVERPPR